VVSLLAAKKKDKAIGSKVRMLKEISTSVLTKTTRNTVMENSLGKLVVDTKASIPKIPKKVTVKCTGLTDRYTEDSGIVVFKLA